MSATAITVYWRPGCGFSSSLVRQLERSGLDFARVDIWSDEDGAAFVRHVANGNETVPTVRIADLALINPSARDVLREVVRRVPEALPADHEVPEPPGREGGRLAARRSLAHPLAGSASGRQPGRC